MGNALTNLLDNFAGVQISPPARVPARVDEVETPVRVGGARRILTPELAWRLSTRRVAALAQHGGFLSVLPLVVEYVIGKQPLERLIIGSPVYEAYPNYRATDNFIQASGVARHPRRVADGVRVIDADGPSYDAAFTAAVAAARRQRNFVAVTLRAVSRAWRDAPFRLPSPYFGPPATRAKATVPLPFQWLRVLSLDFLHASHGYELTDNSGPLPAWFGGLGIEEIHVEDSSFCLPPLPALPNLKRVTAYCSTFEFSADEMSDRPLEVVVFDVDRGSEWNRFEFQLALEAAFGGTVCAGTLRELVLGGHGKELTSLPACFRGLHRLEKLDVSQCEIESLPGWLGELPLVELNLWSTDVSSLPASLRSCRTLRLLNLSLTRLGPVRDYNDEHNTLVLDVPPGYVEGFDNGHGGPTNYIMPFRDVPAEEIARRTNELMSISLALPDLRIKCGTEDGAPLWHAGSGKAWFDPEFHDLEC